MKKRILSGIIILSMFLSVLSVGTISVCAATGQDIVNDLVNNYVGKYPYVLNTHGPSTFDCSGLVYYVYKQYGVNLPYTTKTDWTKYGEVIRDTAKLQSGDILLFGSSNTSLNHMGVYDANGGYIIQALNTNYGIIRKPKLSEWISSSSWNSNGSNQFQFAIRVFGGGGSSNSGSVSNPGNTSSSKPYITDTSRTLRWKELNSKYDKTTEELQRCLNFIMNAGLTVDGVYGIATHDVVKEFQGKYGLTVDGDAGPMTLKKVNEVINGMSGTHSHNIIIESETLHPHKEYRRCTSCGHTEYTGNNITVNYCSQCTASQKPTTENAKFEPNSYVARIFGDNGHEYRMYNYVCSWEDAKELCEDMDGYLATITSRSEFNEVVSFIKKYSDGSYYYIGGTDKQNEGTWKWVTGEKWSFNDLWNPGEPNNAGDEDYMSLYQLANDLPATSHLGFICEIEEETIEPESFTLNKNKIELNEGETYTVNVNVFPSDCSEYSILWETDDSSIAKVNNKGKITAVSPGKINISATLLDSNKHMVETQYCTVIVSELHEHNYIAKYETKHPHQKYMECECGEVKQSTQTKKMDGCKECYPDVEKKTLKLQIGVPDMYVNGKSQEIDPGRGTAPVIKNSRTLLPIRAIAESFGAYIVWDETEQKVTVYASKATMQFWIDSNEAIVNNEVCTLDVAPVIINGRTFMPLRFIAENMGLTVGWNDANQTITIEGSI